MLAVQCPMAQGTGFLTDAASPQVQVRSGALLWLQSPAVGWQNVSNRKIST